MIGRLALALCILSMLMYRLYVKLDLHISHIEDQNADSCRRLEYEGQKMMVQPEDVVIYKHILITQSYDKVNTWRQSIRVDTQSMLLQLNINNLTGQQIQPIELRSMQKDIQFRPFGMRVYGDRLYVINEGYDQGGESVIVFRIQMDQSDAAIQYLEMVDLFRFDAEYIGQFNSLEVIGSDQLLITQWLPFADSLQGRQYRSFTQMFRNAVTFFYQLFGIKQTYVFYCNKDKSSNQSRCQKIKNSEQSMNNGIQKSVNYVDRVFVSNPLESAIYYYQLDIDKLEFTLLDKLVFETHVDNVHVDPITKNYYTAGNDLIIEFLKSEHYYQDKQSSSYIDSKSTGSVYTFKETGDGQIVIDRLMRSNYKLKGISSAIGYRNVYFVGSVLDDALLVCRKDSN